MWHAYGLPAVGQCCIKNIQNSSTPARFHTNMPVVLVTRHSLPTRQMIKNRLPTKRLRKPRGSFYIIIAQLFSTVLWNILLQPNEETWPSCHLSFIQGPVSSRVWGQPQLDFFFKNIFVRVKTWTLPWSFKKLYFLNLGAVRFYAFFFVSCLS